MNSRLVAALFVFLTAIAGLSSEVRGAGVPPHVGSLFLPPVSSHARPFVILDSSGTRGIVLFDHALHEGLTFPATPLQPKPGVSCIGCHHTTKHMTAANEFQKCTACHKLPGDPTNPEDKQGFDLNAPEVFHRNCAGCHLTANIKASNEWFHDAGFIRCGECHLRIPPPLNPEAKALPAPPPMPQKAVASLKRFDFLPQPDRWRIENPQGKKKEPLHWWDPYHQNALKGDYPIAGNEIFLNIGLESNSLTNFRSLPAASDVSSQQPGSAEFFGRGRQFFFRPNSFVSFDLFKGDTSYRPVDWRILIAPNFNINYARAHENGIVDIDVDRGISRTDGKISLQEVFGEYRIGDTTRLLPFLKRKDKESPYYDFTSARFGVQPFVSDFRGFVFRDTNLGLRFFGTYADNRYQFNATAFNMLEKDTNSELNRLDFRHQVVYTANLFRQDTLWNGYTAQFSLHFDDDHASRHFDRNGFLVRPALIGSARPHHIQAAYLGWAGDGHIGRLNLTHAFYEVLGTDDENPIAGRDVRINAQMAAVELSQDRNWMRWKTALFWASGDANPQDGSARGFDAILDAPEFVGGNFSFWNSQGIKLLQTNVNIVNPDSLLPDLRSSKIEGQANFVNPGILIAHLGFDADLTHKLKLFTLVNYLRFHHTEPLETVLFQPGIRKTIGIDYGAGILYRPFLSENAVLTAGFSSLIPGSGFKDIYSSNCSEQGCGADAHTLYSYFIRIRLTY